MKKVKLYTLKVEDVIVSGDYVEISSFNRDEAIKIRNSDEFVLPTTKVKCLRIPIEKYYGRYISSGWDTSKEYLVAFDPEIKKILQTKEKELEGEILELKRENVNSLKALSEIHHTKEMEYTRKISSFKNMSFWARLKFLFMGNKIKFKKVEL